MDGVGGSDAELVLAEKEKVKPLLLSDDITCRGSGLLKEIGFNIG